MTRSLCFAALCWMVLWAPLARASDNDYLPYNTSWNGLSGLDALARARGTRVVLMDQLNWDKLPPDASLMIIHPLTRLKVDRIKPFLEGGGRLLVADDFGGAKPLLSSFKIMRLEQGARSSRKIDGNPNLLVARVGPAPHALTAGVSEIATNHPAYFMSPYSTLADFGRGTQQLLVAGKVGKGQLIALSDPSVLINAMLPWSDNKRFAGNLIGQLLPAEGQPIYLVTGYFDASGKVQSSSSREGALPRLLKEFNQFLGIFSDYAMLEPGLRALGIICGGLTVMGLLLLLPLPRRDLDGHWIRPQGPAPWGLEEEVGRAGNRLQGGVAYPAAVLREEVEELLGEIIGAPGPLSTIHPRWVVNQVRDRAGEEAATLCARLMAALKRVPQPSAVADNPLLSGVSIKDLDNIYSMSSKLFIMLGKPPLPDATRQSDHVSHRRS